MSIMSAIDLKIVMKIHSIICIVVGLAAVSMPHGLYSRALEGGSASTAGYNHMAHEFVRLYGCLTLGTGWFVWSTKDIRDGRLMRAISETFSICYCMQAFAMLRAQFTDPTGHTILHWLIGMIFLVVGALYGYIRLFSKIKAFELPGIDEE